jgi:hypothetical protein
MEDWVDGYRGVIINTIINLRLTELTETIPTIMTNACLCGDTCSITRLGIEHLENSLRLDEV